jgi:hypothetical protein
MGAPSLSTKSPMSNPVVDIESLVMDDVHSANLPALQQLIRDMDGLTEWKASIATSLYRC